MIITAENIRQVRPVASNIDDIKRIEPYINEAEKLLVLPAIGASLYKQLTDIFITSNTNILITNNLGEAITLTLPMWNDLLNGCFYNSNNSCDELKYCEGLISATAYLAYARFLSNQGLNVTAFGVMQKRGEFSGPVSEQTLVRASKQAEKIGLEYLQQCVDYLKSNNFIRTNIQTRTIRKFKTIG